MPDSVERQDVTQNQHRSPRGYPVGLLILLGAAVALFLLWPVSELRFVEVLLLVNLALIFFGIGKVLARIRMLSERLDKSLNNIWDAVRKEQ